MYIGLPPVLHFGSDELKSRIGQDVISGNNPLLIALIALIALITLITICQ